MQNKTLASTWNKKKDLPPKIVLAGTPPSSRGVHLTCLAVLSSRKYPGLSMEHEPHPPCASSSSNQRNKSIPIRKQSPLALQLHPKQLNLSPNNSELYMKNSVMKTSRETNFTNYQELVTVLHHPDSRSCRETESFERSRN